jgi:hypothetical protein
VPAAVVAVQEPVLVLLGQEELAAVVVAVSTMLEPTEP